MANSQESDSEIQGVTRRRLLQTVSTAAVVGLQSALGGNKTAAATLSPGSSAMCRDAAVGGSALWARIT